MVAVEKRGAMATAERGIPSEVYHMHPSTSNSQLGEFLDNRELFHARYIAKTLPLKKQTAEMAFGSLFHDVVLFGLHDKAILVPESVLSKDGKRAGTAFKEFAEEHAGKSLLLREDFTRLQNMVDAVSSHKIASKLLNFDDAAVEESIFWADATTELKLRCRPDVRRISMPLLVDLKTTTDVSPKALATSVHNFGYNRQSVFYKEGAKLLTGVKHDFMFIAVEKEPPHRVVCFDLHQRAIEKGYEDYRGGLDALAEAYRTNAWHSPGWNLPLSIDLPNWAYNNEWEVDFGDRD